MKTDWYLISTSMFPDSRDFTESEIIAHEKILMSKSVDYKKEKQKEVYRLINKKLNKEAK